MNAYEITYIVRPDLDEDQTRAVIDQVTGRLESASGEILAVVPWNPPRRRMAYTINDFGDGFYVTTVFRVDPQELRGIESTLKLNDRVLRYLLVQATEMNIKQAQQRVQQAQAAAAAPRPPMTASAGEPGTVTETVPVAPEAAEPAVAEAVEQAEPAPEAMQGAPAEIEAAPEPVVAATDTATTEPEE